MSYGSSSDIGAACTDTTAGNPSDALRRYKTGTVTDDPETARRRPKRGAVDLRRFRQRDRIRPVRGERSGEAIKIDWPFIEPSKRSWNGFVESFKGRVRDEPRDEALFFPHAQVTIAFVRETVDFNTQRSASQLQPAPPIVCCSADARSQC